MSAVGIRQLKSELSRYLQRVKAGERITVTERGTPVAIISPATESPTSRRLEGLLGRGVARWDGGKPRGSARPPRVKGPTVAAAVLEDRR